jgi:hypothetical protein
MVSLMSEKLSRMMSQQKNVLAQGKLFFGWQFEGQRLLPSNVRMQFAALQRPCSGGAVIRLAKYLIRRGAIVPPCL